MKEYQCHKKVHASPMNRGDYNVYKGWKLPDDEKASDPGYLVVYSKDTVAHYESWSPKDVFENGYKEFKTTDLTFGEALELAKKGHRLQREGWNGNGMFFYYVPKSEYPARMDAIKGYYSNDYVPYRAYLALKTAQDDVSSWTPSISDNLADDWRIVD